MLSKNQKTKALEVAAPAVTEEGEPVVGVSRLRRRAGGVQAKHIALIALTLVALAACAPGEAPPTAVCDTYDRALFTTQLMGGASLILAVALLGLKKNLSTIVPTMGSQTGAVAASMMLGLILLAFSTDIGNQILTGFGVESLYTLCGLG
jgi:hypothetical protein